jgi:hypothetical protein
MYVRIYVCMYDSVYLRMHMHMCTIVVALQESCYIHTYINTQNAVAISLQIFEGNITQENIPFLHYQNPVIFIDNCNADSHIVRGVASCSERYVYMYVCIYVFDMCACT